MVLLSNQSSWSTQRTVWAAQMPPKFMWKKGPSHKAGLLSWTLQSVILCSSSFVRNSSAELLLGEYDRRTQGGGLGEQDEKTGGKWGKTGRKLGQTGSKQAANEGKQAGEQVAMSWKTANGVRKTGCKPVKHRIAGDKQVVRKFTNRCKQAEKKVLVEKGRQRRGQTR